MKKQHFIVFICASIVTWIFIQCNEPSSVQPEESVKSNSKEQFKKIHYHLDSAKGWMAVHKSDTQQLQLVAAINRTDRVNFSTLDTILVPDEIISDSKYYFHFPATISGLKKVNKLIFFSYPSQTFGAYEKGKLVYSGPTNMGRKKDPTPAGLYFTNWKAEQTTSTFNDEWELKWNFNIENKKGIGWHQYSLPGYPASHSCLRLNEKDARYLYNWADEWIISKENKDSILAKGTPVIVFGNYNFNGRKPWLQLASDPDALNIPIETLEQLIIPHLNTILNEQDRRQKVDTSNIQTGNH